MTVADELEHVLFYVTDVVYRIVRAFYEALEGALVKVWGEEAGRLEIPTLIRAQIGRRPRGADRRGSGGSCPHRRRRSARHERSRDPGVVRRRGFGDR